MILLRFWFIVFVTNLRTEAHVRSDQATKTHEVQPYPRNAPIERHLFDWSSLLGLIPGHRKHSSNGSGSGSGSGNSSNGSSNGGYSNSAYSRNSYSENGAGGQEEGNGDGGDGGDGNSGSESSFVDSDSSNQGKNFRRNENPVVRSTQIIGVTVGVTILALLSALGMKWIVKKMIQEPESQDKLNSPQKVASVKSSGKSIQGSVARRFMAVSKGRKIPESNSENGSTQFISMDESLQEKTESSPSNDFVELEEQ